MKRSLVFAAGLIALFLLVGFTLKSETEDLPIQFQGTVKYPNGSSAPVGTTVQAYLGSVKKGEVTVTIAGYYELTGNPVNFTTGTYQLVGNDNSSASGDENCYRVQDTDGTVCNIVLDTVY